MSYVLSKTEVDRDTPNAWLKYGDLCLETEI